MHPDLNIQRVLEPLLDLKFRKYGKRFSNVLTNVQAQMQPVIIDNEQRTKDKRYMYYEEGIVLPRECVPGMMKWSPAMKRHPVAKESLLHFSKWLSAAMDALSC